MQARQTDRCGRAQACFIEAMRCGHKDDVGQGRAPQSRLIRKCGAGRELACVGEVRRFNESHGAPRKVIDGRCGRSRRRCVEKERNFVENERHVAMEQCDTVLERCDVILERGKLGGDLDAHRGEVSGSLVAQHGGVRGSLDVQRGEVRGGLFALARVFLTDFSNNNEISSGSARVVYNNDRGHR